MRFSTDLLMKVKAICDEPLDERQGFGPTRASQFRAIDGLLEGLRFLPCGCIEREQYDAPCEPDQHDWSHWHPGPMDALREDRFCAWCGAMETQRIGEAQR